jgi:hypothetical protein
MEVSFFFAYGFKYFRVSQMLVKLNHMKAYDETWVKWFFRGIIVALMLAYVPFVPV